MNFIHSYVFYFIVLLGSQEVTEELKTQAINNQTS